VQQQQVKGGLRRSVRETHLQLRLVPVELRELLVERRGAQVARIERLCRQLALGRDRRGATAAARSPGGGSTAANTNATSAKLPRRSFLRSTRYAASNIASSASTRQSRNRPASSTRYGSVNPASSGACASSRDSGGSHES